jgi:hypothetical protein
MPPWEFNSVHITAIVRRTSGGSWSFGMRKQISYKLRVSGAPPVGYARGCCQWE